LVRVLERIAKLHRAQVPSAAVCVTFTASTLQLLLREGAGGTLWYSLKARGEGRDAKSVMGKEERGRASRQRTGNRRPGRVLAVQSHFFTGEIGVAPKVSEKGRIPLKCFLTIRKDRARVNLGKAKQKG